MFYFGFFYIIIKTTPLLSEGVSGIVFCVGFAFIIQGFLFAPFFVYVILNGLSYLVTFFFAEKLRFKRCVLTVITAYFYFDGIAFNVDLWDQTS